MQSISPDYINHHDRELVELFISSTKQKKYILGINKLTRCVQKLIKVDGIIDDFTRVQRSRKKEILQIEDVPKDALILSTATGSPLQVIKRLNSMGLSHINYLALCKYSSLALVPPPFIMDFEEDYLENKEQYKRVYTLLADTKSKELFTRVLNFKISFDYTFMEGFSNDHKGQYFDKEILPPLKNIRFVDGGGYVGDTASEVIENYPDFAKIYLIEPIEENIRIAKRELAEYKNIEFISSGISNKKAKLLFNEEKSFSTIYGKGTQSVEVDTIDNLICEPIDYIKLDIEGAEQEAIEGARETIKAYRPILAICVYHKAQDWHKIPLKILSIESSYKIYFRHYMEGIFESVIYFIPPDKNPL